MKDRPTLQELVEVQRLFGLQTQALVEKDWFVVRALTAIVGADKGPFKLVFQGGTALSRAHRLIERMSEDLDFKIVATEKQPRSAYRRLREKITQALLDAGFAFDPKNEDHRKSMYSSEYTLFRLPYQPAAGSDPALRPEDPNRDIGLADATTLDQSRGQLVRGGGSFKRPADIAAIACAGTWPRTRLKNSWRSRDEPAHSSRACAKGATRLSYATSTTFICSKSTLTKPTWQPLPAKSCWMTLKRVVINSRLIATIPWAKP